MQVEIDLRKTLQENASLFHEKSKAAKKKLAGLEQAVGQTKKRIAAVESGGAKEKTVQPKAKKREKKWHEAFHWFFSSENCLVVAGRDAKSNETLVKTRMDKDDVYLHADIHGAPHTIVKAGACKTEEGCACTEKTLEEAAQFAASLSSAWKDKAAVVDVYSVKPEQVSKSAPSGEAVGKGAFMIYGQRTWFRKTPLKFAIGLKRRDSGWAVVSGPPSAIKAHADFFVEVAQGSEPKGETAKKIKSLFEGMAKEKTGLEIDEFVSMLPAGECRVLG